MPVPNSCVRRALIFTVGVVLFAGPRSAPEATAAPNETGRPYLQSFTPRDYHGHNQVWAAVQDANGVMWFGNQACVLAYDGSAWRRFPVPIAHVRALGFAPDGRLYVCGADALGYLAPDADGLPAYTSLLDQLPPELRPPGTVWGLAVTPDAVFFTTDQHVLRWQGGRFRVWTHAEPRRQYAKFVDGVVYLHRRGEGLFRFDGENFQLLSDAPEIKRSRFLALIGGGPRGLLVAADHGAFFQLQAGQLSSVAAAVTPLLAGTQVLAALRLPDGGIALATIAGGIFQLTADGALVRRLDEAAGLPNQGVLNLAADREGGTWICTQNGVARAEFAAPWSIFDQRNGLGGALVFAVARHEGTLYAATNAGLARLVPGDPATGSGAHFEPLAVGGHSTRSLLSHPSGLLLATDDGLRLFDGRDAVPLLTGPLVAGELVESSPGQPDVVYFGHNSGINRFHFDGHAWQDDGLAASPAPVTNFAEAADGTRWIGTENRGFARLATPPGPAGWPRTTLTFFNHDHGLPANQGNSRVVATPYGVVFTTDHGTFRFDSATGHFVADTRLVSPEVPFDSSLWPMTVADDATLWIEASLLGPAPYSIGSLRPTGRAAFAWHQLPSKLIDLVSNVGASSIALEGHGPDATLWINGPEASVRVALAAPLAPRSEWTALITVVTLPGGRLLSPAANAPISMRLPFAREPLRIAFAAPRFSAGALEFQTRLVGYDDAWSPWSARTEAQFTNLYGGPFTFEVRARDPDGVMSAPARWTFAVAPPAPLRPLAFALYAAVLGAAVYLFVRWRLGRARRERLRLEALVATRTRELALARDAAESASRAKSSFLASMSHELRTPLNGVLGYAQLLQDDRRLAPDQRERVRIVQHSGEHLLHMINDVLDLAKIEAGKLTLHPAPFALGELLQDIAAAHAPTAAAKRLAFAVDLAPGLPAWVEADAPKLRQVLDNLLGNAVKFTASGRVTLDVRGAGDDRIAFTVVDTGPGIAAADQPRLFQAFEQAAPDHATATGTGLGLAISRALVEHLGGALTLDSAPGRGSTFSFSLALPAASPGAAGTTAGRRIVGYSGPPLRAIIVDDHLVNRRLLGELLAPLGFACAEYSSAADALARLATGAEPWPAIAIIDLRMPGIDGLELTRRLRALPLGSKLKIVLTSASVIAFDPREATRAGCDDFLPKPFHTADLLEKIGRLLQLTWQASDSASPHPVAARPGAPLPEAARAALHEALASGDLEAFAAELARQRTDHPAAAGRLDELGVAAASFQLARLRQLLE